MTRREFLKTTALTTAAMPFASMLRSASAAPAGDGSAGPVKLRWLDGHAPAAFTGATCGVPWPRGRYPKNTTFALRAAGGAAVPVQSWPLATWPDGSLKWTAHALPADVAGAESFALLPNTAPTAPATPLTAMETDDAIEINTGVSRFRMAKKGTTLIHSIVRGDQEIARDGRLVCVRQDRAEAGADGVLKQEPFVGDIASVSLDQNGPIRALVKIEGKHKSAVNGSGRAWLPFVVRLYFYAGSDAVRMVHTITYDGDENQDFIRGLGVRFSVPMRGELHDRHVRFSGEGNGLFGEAVRGLTGLRRDPGRAVTSAQVAGKATPPVDTFPPAVRNRLHLIPAFGDWTLFQPNSDSFEIRKRTKESCTWLRPKSGRRAAGLGYIGTPQGGMAFGIRNFWQSHPAQFDIRGATGDTAEVTMWLWAPDAPVMDMRFYHDGMGEDTYAEQIEGLEITYEDFEPGFEKPYGVARTSEMYLWALPATPEREYFVKLADAVRAPAVVICTPEYLSAVHTFGGVWSLPDRSNPAEAKIDDALDWYFSYYQKQVDQRRWYGFWNFGDVMHSYDAARHVWKYDVGGFAWDNTELSTEIWLWLHFLRTGSADVFRFAEAMTRHTGEVDVHHIGRFAPLGSRHNVIHWGDSAKQMRISTAQNKRYYYYLTGDERVGDLMRDQLDALRTLVRIQPNRKAGGRGVPREVNPNAKFARVSFGTDWGSLSAAWLTEWERTGDEGVKQKLLNSMKTIAAQPHGFFSSGSRMNLETGEFEIAQNQRAEALHLNAVFGEVEVCAELFEMVDLPEFKKAWLQYCELYNASADEQQSELGNALGKLNLGQGHSRLTAFAAKEKGDAALAKRAWNEFYAGSAGIARNQRLETQRIEGPAVLEPIDEARWVSTNAVAQWGLAAIQCLAFAGNQLAPE